jgi:hypothetical protein
VATEVLRTSKITLNSVDLSDHISQVAIDETANEVDFTAFGSTYTIQGQGMKDATITLTAFNDHAAASVADTLQPLFETGGTFPVKIWPASAGTVVYTMTGRLYNKPSVAGAVGDASTVDITIRNAGTAGVTRGTS